MERKEQWIEGTLNSMENMRRAKVGSGLYEKLMVGARQGVKVIPISSKTVWRAAAGIALLIVLNVFSIARLNNNGNQSTQKNAFAQEYFSYVSEVQL